MSLTSEMLFLCTFIPLLQWAHAIGSLTLSLTSPTINSNSIYQFEIVDTNLDQYSGSIHLIFDSTLFTLSSLSCYNTNEPSEIYSHSLVNDYTISIDYTLVPNSNIFRVSVDSVTNPSSQQSVTFTYIFYDSSAN
jgi:hypothetical protein